MMELSLLITGILGIIVLFFIFWLLNTKNDHWEKLGVPSVKSPPIIGFLWELIFKNKGVGDVMYELYIKFKEQKFIGYYQFLSPAIMVREPELVNHVLIKDFTHFEDRIFPMEGPKSIISLGVGSLTGDEWRNARHKLTPTFTSGKLKMMTDPIRECSDELLRHIENSLGEEFEAKDLMFKFVLNVSANVGFGIKLNVFDEKDKQSQAFIKYTSMFNKPSVLFLIKHMIAAWVPKLRAIFNFRLMEEDVEMFFKGLTHDVIKNRKNSNIRRNDFLQLVLDEQEKELSNDLGSNKSRERESADAEDKELLDQLKNTPLGSSDSLKPVLFTEEFISAQSFIFISVGSHTTSTVLSVVLHELAAHQDLQKKVQNEITNVFSSQEFSYETLRKLTYTEQFLNEVMRLYPTALALIRVCTRDYKIPGTEITIPKGSLVNIPIIGLHKDPQYFPDPEKLDPDRFENMDAIPKGVFFPFGGGPRICIAVRLAMLKMKILLSRLLLNYTVVFGGKMEHPLKISKSSYVLRLESEIWVKFKRRET